MAIKQLNRFSGMRGGLALAGVISIAWTMPCHAQQGSAAASLLGALHLRDESLGTVATTLVEFKEDFVVGGVDFNADGTQLASNAMFDGLDVHIWDLRGNPRITRILHKTAPAGPGNAIQYSPDGALLAVGHELDTRNNGFGLVRIWNAYTGKIVYDIAEPDGATEKMEFAFSPDGKAFVRTVDRGGGPGNYFVVHRTDTWDISFGLPTLPFFPHVLALSPNGRFAALGRNTLVTEGLKASYQPKILIINLGRKAIVRSIDQPFPAQNEIQKLAWSPDGKALAAGAVVGGSFPGPSAVKVFDPATGAEVLAEQAASAYVYSLTYSPDGRYLVEGWLEGHVRIWDGPHRHLLQTIPVNEHFDCVVKISRDSRYMAIAVGKEIAIWKLK
jgi:WD40 repeat protein